MNSLIVKTFVSEKLKKYVHGKQKKPIKEGTFFNLYQGFVHLNYVLLEIIGMIALKFGHFARCFFMFLLKIEMSIAFAS